MGKRNILVEAFINAALSEAIFGAEKVVRTREEFEQRAETILAKSESERNAGAVFGQFSETERLEKDGESESAEKEEGVRREIT